MKLFNEKKAVKGMIEISKAPSPFIKKNYAIALTGLLFSVGIILYLIFFSKNIGTVSSHLLSFLAGVWLVWSWVKVTEVYGIEFIVKYIDIQKIEERNVELANDTKANENTLNPIVKMLLTVLIWAVVAYGTLYVIDIIKSV